MLKDLFPNLKDLKIFYTSDPEGLRNLFLKPFSFKVLKRSASHLVFLLIPLGAERPFYFLKAYQPRPFKRNRVKAFVKNYERLQKRGVPLLHPLAVFLESPVLALLKKHPFYGGLLYPFLEEGFLTGALFLKEKAKDLLSSLVRFNLELHAKGVLLGDTKYDNFYLDAKEGFKIFDLDGVKILDRCPTPEEQLKDLSALAMTLEWIGFKEAGTLIFEDLLTLIPGIDTRALSLFRKGIERKRHKRLKKTQPNKSL